MSAFTRHLPKSWPGRIVGGIVCLIAVIILSLFIASFFLDGFVRSETEATLNRNLKGFRATLGHAHLQIIGGTLTLRDLVIIQEAHPSPPVANLREIVFSINIHDLFIRRVVANVYLWQPRIRVNEEQLSAEETSKTPISQQGWQQAVEEIYPFKINHFRIQDGDVVYIQNPKQKPLHMSRIYIQSDNIRNIRSPNRAYPSTIYGDFVVFGSGHMSINGQANYLAVPIPGVRARFNIKDVPLSTFDPELRQLNLAATGGLFSGAGELEYNAKVCRVNIGNANIDRVALDYIHTPQTAQAESRRVQEAGQEIEAQNNGQAVFIYMKELRIRDSSILFNDRSAHPPFRVYMDDMNLTMTNLSNHQQKKPGQVGLTGRFMDSGQTNIKGTMDASRQGPDFKLNLAILNTNLPSMNNIFSSYGKFQVAAGEFSVYSQMSVKNNEMGGYVKPMFTHVKVYSHQMQKHASVVHKAKELLIGAASHVFRNHRTQTVATQVPISGKLSSPTMNNWQAFVEVLRNAFIKAIVPGFNDTVGAAAAAR